MATLEMQNAQALAETRRKMQARRRFKIVLLSPCPWRPWHLVCSG